MNRGAVLLVTLFVLLSSVVPVSALSYSATSESPSHDIVGGDDAGVDAFPSDTRSVPGPSADETAAAQTGELDPGNRGSVAQPGPSVTIGTSDGGDPVERSVLVVTNLDGFQGDLAYRWFRTQRPAAPGAGNAWTEVSDSDDSTGPDRYNLNDNGLLDAGHRFKLRVTDTSGNLADSNVVAVAPAKPRLHHPAVNEQIRVNRPYFNLGNVPHTPSADVTYDFQVIEQAACGGATIGDADVVVEGAGIEERDDSYGITHWHSTDSLTAGQTYCWRARADVGDVNGAWSDTTGFTIAAVDDIWSEDGESWHWPFDASVPGSRRLSGTFMEGYYHGGYVGRLHGGLDVPVNNHPVRASRSGRLVQRGAGITNKLTLHHDGQPEYERTQYLHMRGLTTLPLGTYVNQGTRLGTASDAGPKGTRPHLHFDVTDWDESAGAITKYYNPLVLGGRPIDTTTFGWSPTGMDDPKVESIRLRNKQFLENRPGQSDGVKDRDFGGNVFVIARTTQESGSSPNNLAPYRVKYEVGARRGDVREIIAQDEHQFDELTVTSGIHESDIYAYRNPRLCVRGDIGTDVCKGNSRRGNPPYLMYFKWDTSGLPVDGGPYGIRWESADFYGNSGDKTITIGAQLNTNRNLVVFPCQPPEDSPTEPSDERVEITIENWNDGLETGISDDTYTLSLKKPGWINARLLKDDKAIPNDELKLTNGKSDTVTLQIDDIPETDPKNDNNIQVIATSEIITSVKDRVNVTVNKNCGNTPPPPSPKPGFTGEVPCTDLIGGGLSPLSAPFTASTHGSAAPSAGGSLPSACDPVRPPGGDHPDDNHDLSVLDYDRASVALEHDSEASIAVLDRGFVDEFEDFLAARNLTAEAVDVRTPQEDLDGYDVLVVPSGGLLGLSSLASFEAKLDAFVRNGGTLVVLSQRRGYEYGPVPGDLKGYGWLEDQSCQYGSVGVTNSCAVVSSVTTETASVNVDGYFTDWPADATVQLSRTVNSQPALLTYDHGEGRVLATTIYTDWASGHHASSQQGEALLRNVLAWATSPPDLPTYRPGETVTLDTNVTNEAGSAADEVRVDLRSPDGIVRSVASVRTRIEGSSTRPVDTTYTAPGGEFGIWTVGFTLLNDSIGELQRVADVDRLAVSRFSSGEGLFRSEDVTFAVTSDAERYAEGSNATFRITVRNGGSTDETVTAFWVFPHNYWETGDPRYGLSSGRTDTRAGRPNETVVVPAGGEITIVDEIPVFADDRLWARFYRGDRASTDYLGSTSRGFFAFRPAVETEVTTGAREYRRGERVDVSLELDGTASETRTDVRVVGPESTLVYEDALVADLAGGPVAVEFGVDLPVDAPTGFYTVVAEPYAGGEKVGFDSAQFFVPGPRIRVTPEVPDVVANASRVAFVLYNGGGEVADTTVDVSLEAPDGSTVWSDSQTADVPVGGRRTVEFDVETGPRRFGDYRLRYTVDAVGNDPLSRVYDVPSSWLATLEFDAPSYRIREELGATVTVTNDGLFGDPVPVELSVPDAGYVDSTDLVLVPGESGTVEHTVTLPESLAQGEHEALVTLGRADTITERFTFVVPPSALRTSVVSGGPYAAGGDVPVEITNTGGVDTEAACTFVLTGPRGVGLGERDVTATVRAGETATVDAVLPEQAVSGTYFLETTCEDRGTGETTDRLETFEVAGLSATVASTTDQEVYAPGEDVTVTTTVTNAGDEITDGSLTLRIVDTSAAESATGSATTSVISTAHADGFGVSPADSVRPTLASLVRWETDADTGTTETPLIRESRALVTTDVVELERPLATGTAPSSGLEAVDFGLMKTDTGSVVPTSRSMDPARVSVATIASPTDARFVDTTETWTDRTVVLDESLVINATGSLTLENTSLVFDNTANGEHGLVVRSGGELRVLDGSSVAASNPRHHYYFQVADGATFEMRGATVSDVGYGGRDSTVEGLYIAADGAVIEDSRLEGNHYAILVDGASDIRIQNNSFRQNFEDDVLLNDAHRNVVANNSLSGYITLVEATNNTLEANRLNGAVSRRGRVVVARSDHTEVLENVIIGGKIVVSSSDGSTVVGNDVSEARETGISLSESANVTVTDNRVSKSAQYGLYLNLASNATVRNNTLTDNGWGDFFVGPHVGEVPPFPPQFSLDLDSYRHTIVDNEVSNGPLYYWVDRNDATAPPDAGVVWLVGGRNLTVTSGRQVGIIAVDNATVRDVNVSGTRAGLIARYSPDLTIRDSVATGNGHGFSLERSDDALLINNTAFDNDVVASGGSSFVVASSDRITMRDNRVSGEAVSGFRVSDSTDFVATGNEIFEIQSVNDAFRLVRVTRAEIRNNTVLGGDEVWRGLSAEDSDRITLANNTFDRTRGAGVRIGSSSNVDVSDNEMTDVGTGVDLTDRSVADDSRVTGNRIANSTTGIRLARVTGGVVSENVVSASRRGIELSRADDIDILDNVFEVGNDTDDYVDDAGIYLDDSRNNTLRENIITGSAEGLFVDIFRRGSRNDDVLPYYRHDVDTSNTVDGRPIYYWVNESDATVPTDAGPVWLVGGRNLTVTSGEDVSLVGVEDALVDGIEVSGDRYGVFVYRAADVTVTGVTARNNTRGIHLEDSDRIEVVDSTATGNEWGIHLERANGSVLARNEVRDNEDGVFLRSTSRATVADNEVAGNEDVGIFVSGSSRVSSENTLTGNRVADNGWGIQVFDAENNTFTRNVVVDNSDLGLRMDGRNNLVYDNYIDNPEARERRSDAADFRGDDRWNVTQRPGENILGGPFIGGNFWGGYEGVDTNGDGIGDTRLPYDSSGNLGSGGDYHPLVPEQATGGPVVFETTVPFDAAVGATGTLTTTVPASALDGRRGKMKLTTELVSATTQTVAVEDPPFYVVEGETALTLAADAERYRPGETVSIAGTLENRGGAEATYDLSVSAGGTELLAESVTLAAGETHSYATSVEATVRGRLSLVASADGVVVEDSVEVIEPQVTAGIVAPDAVGRAPFEAALELENTGRIDATLEVAFLGTSRRVVLAPNETRLLSGTTAVTGDAVLEAVIGGDVARTLAHPVTFGEAATLVVSPERVYTEGTVAVPYTVENNGTLPTEFDAAFALDGLARTRTVFLPVGGTTSGTLVFDLAAGEYALTYETPFEDGSTTVRVAERNQVTLVADAADRVVNGTLVVNVSLANTGPNDVQGSLRVNSTAFDTASEFAVATGETLNRTVNVTVPEGTAPGSRSLTVEATTEGESLGRVSDAFDVSGARIELVSAPGVKTYGLGELVRLNVTLVNAGNVEGAARVNLTVPGIHEEEQRVFLAPDERRIVPVTFLVPEDLSAGTYPVEYQLDDGPVRDTELVVEGMNVSVAASLDATLYEDGDIAGLALDVTNEGSFPAPLFSRVQYNGYDEIREFDLDADGSTTVAFDVPVRPGRDRKVFYSVYAGSGRSLYIDGVYLHRADPNVTLYTDEQVYEIGETVTISVDPSTAGQLDVFAPGFVWSDTVNGPQELQFTVPELRSGSYNVVYTFANTTRSHPFDVDGYTARVLEASLDADEYVGGDDVGLALDVEANRAVPVSITAVLYDEASTPVAETSASASLAVGRNRVAVVGSLPANTSGVNSVVYRIEADRSTPITLATGSEYFDVAAITGTNAAPVATFDYAPADPVAGDPVMFDATGSSDPDGTLAGFAWDFDGDLAFDATGDRVTHTFAAAGDYTVTLRVTDDGGLANVTARTVSVAAAPTPGDGGDGSDDGSAPPSGGGGQPGAGPGGEVELLGATLAASTVTAGEDVSVEVSLANYDPADGRLTLVLTGDGTAVTERQVLVRASSERTVTLSHRFDAAGTYALAVNGLAAGTVTVEESPETSTPTLAPPTATTSPTRTPSDDSTTATATASPGMGPDTETAAPPTSPSTPTAGDGTGFGVFVALLALGLLVLVGRRRASR